ncbi:MAG: YbjQ family protein [Parvularculaceae bacterium]|nr:YbjQ family protein [Parvularculaceae bacterium]
MLVTTTEVNIGHEITETLGLVRGNVIRARHVGNDFIAGLRNLVGGEVNEYTKMMAEAREQAMDRMIKHAESMGADAVIGTRFTTSTITQGAAEILAFGTAVKLGGPVKSGNDAQMVRRV